MLFYTLKTYNFFLYVVSMQFQSTYIFSHFMKSALDELESANKQHARMNQKEQNDVMLKKFSFMLAEFFELGGRG